MKIIKFCSVLMSLALVLSFAASCSALSGTTPAVPGSATPSSSGANGDNPTAGAIRLATRQAQATLNSQATEGRLAALASETAAAAARVTQTAEAQKLATVLAQPAADEATRQSVVAAKSAWPRRIVAAFADNQLGWPIGLTQDHSLAVTATVAGGRYQWLVTVAHGNSYFNLLPDKGLVQADFYALVNVQFVSGNDDGQSAYGLAFRHVKDDYGFFGILKTGDFRILEVRNTGVVTELQENGSPIDTRPGAINRIAVVGVGPDFVFLINDQVVGQIGASLAAGKIGLAVDAARRASEAQVDFSDFEVYAP